MEAETTPAILTLPDPRLRQPSAAITSSEGLDGLQQTLTRAMMAGPGGVGIAAPQLGIPRRAVVIDCRRARHPCPNHGLLFLINPRITARSGSKPGREGCLSVPDWVATVRRATRITLHYQDSSLEERQLEATGFEARVIQHEIDHLDGILFIDRVTSTRDMIRRMAADTKL